MTDSRKADRQARLAEQLRANLARRKAQTRARRAGEADGREEGIEAAAAEPGAGAPDAGVQESS